MRYFTLFFAAFLLVAGPSSARPIKIRGFVTAVKSPTNFEIDDYNIKYDPSFPIEVERDKSDPGVTTFKPEDIRVGTELEVTGDYDKSTNELNA
jgi:hypothetical protein